MLVLDTSAWIEILLGSKAGITFNERMTEQSVIIVPTTVQLELAKWALREDREQKAQQLGGYTSGFTVVPFDTAIASLAVLCARDHKAQHHRRHHLCNSPNARSPTAHLRCAF